MEVLVVGRGMSAAEVAKMGGWKPADVKRIAEAIELQSRICHFGGPELSDATKQKILYDNAKEFYRI